MSKRVVLGALTAGMLLVLSACAPAPEADDSSGSSDFCARMVTNSGGLEDRSFNEASWAGMERAAEELDIDVDVIVSTSEADLAPNVEQAVAVDCGFVLTVGYELAIATAEQAEANPEMDFAIVDEFVDAENVKPILFDTAQAAYLAGYLAAGVSETGIVATFGGGNQPPVTLFMDGFADGVAKYNEVHGAAVQLLGWDKARQDGVFTGDFEDVNKGLTASQAFIDQGADVIMPVAGEVGVGSARAALESGDALVVWVDSDGYDVLAPEYRSVLLTSVIKNTGDAVVDILGSSLDDSFDNEPYIGSLENEGVGIAPYHDLESRVSPELTAEIEQLRADIIAGTIEITSPSAP